MTGSVSASGGPISDEREVDRIIASVRQVAGMDNWWAKRANALADEIESLRAVLTQHEEALRAAEGVLYALPKSALSKRRTEVLKQVRTALCGGSV